MELSGCPFWHQMDPVEQRFTLKFLLHKSLGHKTAHRQPCSVMGERTHFPKRSGGFVGSRRVIYHVKTKIGQKIPLRPYGRNSTGSGEISFHDRQGAGGVFQYLGAYN
jgi:hypothetical protein